MLKLPNIKNLLSRYRDDEGGNMAMLFAGSAVVVIGTMGAAMDYSTLSNAKARSQSIADATALSAAIFVKDNDRPPTNFSEGFTQGTHSAHALGYEFKGFVEGGASNVDVNVVYDDNAKEARVTVSGNTVPTFIQLLGQQSLEFSAESVVSYLDVDETHPASIVLVLDNSGSMRWDSEKLVAGIRPENPTSRIDGLKRSVRTFRDELNNRIGDQINVDGVRILRTGILPYNSQIIATSDGSDRQMDWGFGGVAESHINSMTAAGGTNSNPPMEKATTWLAAEDETHRQEAIRTDEDYRQPLKFAIFMTDGQNTSGEYIFTPESGTGIFFKQENNFQWFFTRNPWWAAQRGFREGRLTLDTDRQTIESCQTMHAQGTFVYTIGYGLDVGEYHDPGNPSNPGVVSEGTRLTANNLMRACASKPEFFIQASDGAELEAAFDQIQNSIVKELIRIKS